MTTQRTHRTRAIRHIIACTLACAVPASSAFAVKPAHWVHTSEADFENGRFENVVATNFGDLKLSRSVKTILEQDSRVSAVYAIVEAPDKTVYAATGPQGTLLAINGDKVSDAAKLDDGSSIFSLAIDKDGAVLFGTGGEAGKIYRLKKAGAKPEEIFASEGTQYVWAIAALKDGTIYAATGPDGKLFEIKPGGKPEVVFDSNENNLLCLASDGKDLLYIGTDPHGLLYRFNRKTKESFVVHDANESEITTLALATDGTVYAGTAESIENTMPDMSTTESVGGRPEGSGAMDIPSQPPEEPKPPQVPDPNPGEPDPIPKQTSSAIVHPAIFLKKKDKRQTAAKPDEPNAEPTQEAPGEDPGGEPAPGMPGELEPSAPVAPIAPAPPGSFDDSGEPRAGGNAVYRIDTSGFVSEIFRGQVLVLSMIEKDGVLTLGTGSEGRIYQLNPAAEETAVLAKLEPKQVMAMCQTSEGRLLLGLANTGGIASLTSGFASTGTYTSSVLDASQISTFGQLRLHGRLPKGSELLVSTRSGNLSEPTDTGWSKWTDDAPATEYMKIKSPTARFFQYRLTFKSTDSKQTAVVDEADVAYQVPNLPPKVKSVTLATAEPETAPNAAANAAASLAGSEGGDSSSAPQSRGTGKQTITWAAEDPNSDSMRYTISYRSGTRAPWIQMKDDVSETTYEWDTRTVGDGRYEVKVTASDELENALGSGRTASRISDPVVVDNTAPVIADLKAEGKNNQVSVSARGVDQMSPLYSFDYSVDSAKDWQAVLPSDKLCDSPEESVSFAISGLTTGVHQIALRCTDAAGNHAIRTVTVTVEAAK